MKRHVALGALGILLGLSVASPAYAGRRTSFPVYISKSADGSGYFMGQLADVRASAAPSAWMTCSAYTWASSVTTYRYGTCYATDGTTSASCTTSDPALVDAFSKLHGDSYYQVSFNASGTCTFIFVMQGSDQAPKSP